MIQIEVTTMISKTNSSDTLKLLKPEVQERFEEQYLPCPKSIVFTAETIGRIGNQLSIYASLWGLSKKYPTINVYLPDSLLNYLLKWFPNLSLPPLSNIRHCNIKFYNATFAEAGNNIGFEEEKLNNMFRTYG